MGFVFDAMSKAGPVEEIHDGLAPQPPDPCDPGFPPQPQPESDAMASVTGSRPVIDEEAVDRVDDRLVSLVDPACVMSEEYRGIRTRLLVHWQHQRNLIHTITSATPREGKSITSLNLGFTLAEQDDRRVVVVECDLRLPCFTKLLGLSEESGLVQVLHKQVPLKAALQSTPTSHMDVITAGTAAPDEATHLLGSSTMSDLLKQLRAMYDHVILDTPPVLDLADAGIVGRQSDDTLLVVRMNRTPQPLIDQAIRTLQSYDARISGSILTDRQESARGRSYGYRYGYRNYGYQNKRRYRRRSA